MPSLEDTAFKPATLLATAGGSNTSVVATAAAPTNGSKYIVTAIGISVSGAPASAVQATLTFNAKTYTVDLPAALFAPILLNFARPLAGAVNGAVVLTIPALGAGVTGTATIFGNSVGG